MRDCSSPNLDSLPKLRGPKDGLARARCTALHCKSSIRAAAAGLKDGCRWERGVVGPVVPGVAWRAPEDRRLLPRYSPVLAGRGREEGDRGSGCLRLFLLPNGKGTAFKWYGCVVSNVCGVQRVVSSASGVQRVWCPACMVSSVCPSRIAPHKTPKGIIQRLSLLCLCALLLLVGRFAVQPLELRHPRANLPVHMTAVNRAGRVPAAHDAAAVAAASAGTAPGD